MRRSRRKPSARRFARGDYWKRCAKPVLVTPARSLCFPLTRCPLACCALLQFLTHLVMMCVACCGWHSFGCACTHPLVLQPAAYTPPASWSPPQCVRRHRGAACRDARRKAATKASRSRPVQPQKERDALRDQKEREASQSITSLEQAGLLLKRKKNIAVVWVRACADCSG